MVIISKELYILDCAMAYLTYYNLISNKIPNPNNNSAPSSSSKLPEPATTREAGDTVLTLAAMKAV
jgi:hypothetical protein